jgi:hypothetical protein
MLVFSPSIVVNEMTSPCVIHVSLTGRRHC